MGMILLPVIFGAAVIFITALFQLYSLIQGNLLSFEGILAGLLIPVFLITYTTISWIRKGRVYQATPLFHFPLLLIYLPLVLKVGMNFSYGLMGFLDFSPETKVFLNTSFIIWIVFSGLLLYPLIKYHSKYMKKKGVNYYY